MHVGFLWPICRLTLSLQLTGLVRNGGGRGPENGAAEGPGGDTTGAPQQILLPWTPTQQMDDAAPRPPPVRNHVCSDTASSWLELQCNKYYHYYSNLGTLSSIVIDVCWNYNIQNFSDLLYKDLLIHVTTKRITFILLYSHPNIKYLHKINHVKNY